MARLARRFARAQQFGDAERLCRALLKAEGQGQSPVLVCAPAVRAPLRRLLTPHVPRLPVLSYAEIDPALTIETTGVVSDAAAIAA